MVTAIEHHDKATAEVTDIPDIFRSINYPGLVISLRQPLCQHSRSIILNARTQLDEPQTQLCLPKQIFSCASSLMRTCHETSLTVTGFPASPHRIPWSGSLALVERAFRCIKTVDLHVRPVYHWLADRVRSHVFLCMLAYYLEWYMRQHLAPMLFDDTDKDAAEALCSSVVAPAQRSPSAITKQTTGLTADGLPVHSFHSLLADLATLARNTIITAITPDYPLTVVTRPTPIQHKAFTLLGLAV